MKKDIPLIILHGWNLTGGKFTPLVKELEKKGFAVYSPDLPGFGKAKMPQQSFTLADYRDFVVGFMDKKNIRRAVLICHSFGGRVGIKLAVKYPDKAAALILTGVPALPPVRRLKVVFFLTLAKIGKLIFSLPGLSLFTSLFQKILYRLAGASDFYHTKPNLRQTFQNVVAEKLEISFKNLKIPTFLIWGENDKIVPDSIARKMASLKPDVKLDIVSGADHGLPYKLPSVFAGYLIKILENHDF